MPTLVPQRLVRPAVLFFAVALLLMAAPDAFGTNLVSFNSFPRLSPEETISHIHAQGALVGASHPFDRLRGDAIGLANLERIRAELDFLEVFNARMTFSRDNRLAREMAARWGLPGSAGSDAHSPSEVGRAYVDMMAFDGPREFLDSLALGQIGGRLSSPLVHFYSSYAKLRKRWEARWQ